METVDSSKILDATQIEPKSKHAKIIERFLGLKKNDFFILRNDHDPVPLYYQFQSECPGTFTWEYLSKGPQNWETKITRIIEEEASCLSGAYNQTIGEIVAADYRTAEVFSKYGLDFCCNGQKTIKEACAIAAADYDIILKDLGNLEQMSIPKLDKFNKWELDFLADYIIHNHHAYVKENKQMMLDLTEKIATVHGAHHPELTKIASMFRNMVELLESHMVKEESTLFPYVKQLVAAQKKGIKIEKPPFQTIQNPINQMEKEHDDAGTEMEMIRKLSQNFLVPEDGCNTYRVTYAKLEEFEKDLHQHVHLENNILFKKALAVEQGVLA